eukprot:Seg6731.1 transcript_id=Seg6731.1/GoldUCD/mRNA.D3Y31 product="ADP-ribosylation factor-like protein 4A" protein_id=Seg6731.1/GoldUCD/D3Y31
MGMGKAGLMNFIRATGERILLPKPFQITMIGLDDSGKTSILYRLKMNEFVPTAPTAAFNMERIKLAKNTRLSIWDVGGRENIRPLWRSYMRQADGIVFVVDSTDRKRIEEIREELCLALNACRKERVPVLIFANKQDLHYAMDPIDMIEILDLSSLKDKHPWVLQPSSAKTGEGVKDGYMALLGMIDEKRATPKETKVVSTASFPLTPTASEFI